jgi:hypothetical protein
MRHGLHPPLPTSQPRLGTTGLQRTRVTLGSNPRHTPNHSSSPTQGHTASCNRRVCYDDVTTCGHDGESVSVKHNLRHSQWMRFVQTRWFVLCACLAPSQTFVVSVDGRILAYSEDGGRSFGETLIRIYQTTRHRMAGDRNLQNKLYARTSFFHKSY